jgi:lipopolysaccharide/colanic/teichoic acid biosynthesis glycosyltransferase
MSSATLTDMAAVISGWNQSRGKRVFDLAASSLALLLVSPLLLIIAVMVKISSAGPALFCQERVGQHGHAFRLLKFRTMYHATGKTGPRLTRSGDGRITRLGRLLRKSKLDELPQLLNVVRGDMSLVGPRPDVAEYIDKLSGPERRILCLRPGLTSVASLQYRNEEQLLASVPPAELNEFYCSRILPDKVGLDLRYAEVSTLRSDLALLWRTARVICK